MKKFKKVKLEAKNMPTGSYAAGCPEKKRPDYLCSSCELAG